MKRFLSISLATSSALLANIVELNFFYQDYLDFGQNRGAFAAGINGVTIREKNSNTYGDYSDRGRYYDITMPDFIASTDKKYNKSFIGGAYVGSVTHIFDIAGDQPFVSPEMTYSLVKYESYGYDRAYGRYTKFITSGEKLNIIEVTPNSPLDTSRYTHIWRAGSGAMHYRSGNQVISLNGVPSTTGGAIRYAGTFQSDGRIDFWQDGVYFSNMTSSGDSGSPVYAWDTQERQWVAIGWLSSGDINTYTNAVPFSQSAFETFIKKYTNPIVGLNSNQATWSNGNINFNSTSHTASNGKDIILKGGGTITLPSSINQGIGGIYFDSNQTYTITGGNTVSWQGAGLHIEEGTTVKWNVDGVSGDGLHKVGKGTLHIAKANAGWLNLGDGVVILDTDSNAFEHYVLVSGRATLKLAEGRKNALNNTDKLNFSERGGILDLNGNNLTFAKIRASDIGARITNSSQTKSTLTITNANTDAYLFHGQILGNLDILSQAVSENNVLAFDGMINLPNGTLTHTTGELLFQGHPYIHAYFPEERGAWSLIYYSLGQSIFLTPTTLTQSDWEDRVYVLKELNTQTGSSLSLGRNAMLLADLNLIGTTAKFGGVQVYVDRFDGEGANPHNSYKQELTRGDSPKDDSFYYEGNINLAQSSTLTVSNTIDNPLRFGKFIGRDKSNLGVSNASVHYILNTDSTSSAKIKYMEFYEGNGITGNQSKSVDKGKIGVEHLKVYEGGATISGNVALSLETFDPTATNPTPSKLVFSNLQSQLYAKGNASISLSQNTLLQIEVSSLKWETLQYNTLYPLILSQSSIEDNRQEKNIQFTHYNIPDFIQTTTINEARKIGIMFSRNIPQSLMQEANWVEKYASIIIASDPESATIAEINSFREAIKGNEGLMSALLETNLEREKVYRDIYLDTLIQKAGNGDIAPLQNYLNGAHQTIKASSRYGVAILATSLYNSAHYSYLKNMQTTFQNQVAFYRPQSLEKRIRLALNQESINPVIQSDFATPPILELANNSDYRHHLWTDVRGSFLSGDSSLFYNAGLSGGYDYAFITESDEFLSLGFSLHYAFAQYDENDIQDTSHNIIAGIHTQYHISSNEMLFNFYAGGSIANDTNHALVPEFETKRADNTIIQIEGYYKYRFDLFKNENFYHALKPVVGLGYSHLYVPEEVLGNFIVLSEVNSGNAFLKAGLEYNLATVDTQNIFALSMTYNTGSSYKRKVSIGTASYPDPNTYDIDIKPFCFELSYSGSYKIADNVDIFYTLSTQFIPNTQYGMSGNIGGSWSF